jgi:hypothetical protein
MTGLGYLLVKIGGFLLYYLYAIVRWVIVMLCYLPKVGIYWFLTQICLALSFVLSTPVNWFGGVFSSISYYCNFSFLDFLFRPFVKGMYMLSYWDYGRTFTSFLTFAYLLLKNIFIQRFFISR